MLSQPDIYKAQERQRAHHVKSKLKKLIAQIDVARSGTVNWDVFQQLLDLHKIKLSVKNKQKLYQDARENKTKTLQNLIDYRLALRILQPDLDLDEPLAKEWILLSKDSTQIDTVTQNSLLSKTFFTKNEHQSSN